MKFDKLVSEYMRSPDFTGLSLNSQRSYDYAIKGLQQYFRNKEITEIKRSDLIRFLNQNADKPAYANLAIRVASVMFSFAMDLDEIPYNPAYKMRELKIGTHERWDPEDVKKVLKDGNRVITASVALGWYTAQRESDLLELRWRDLKDDHIVLVQTKTKVEMAIKVPPAMVQFLTALRGNEPDDYFIVSGKKPLSPQAFRGRFKRATQRIGITKVFHGLRKGVACDLAEKGCASSVIAAMLGHKTVRMVEHYTKQSQNKKLTAHASAALTGCL